MKILSSFPFFYNSNAIPTCALLDAGRRIEKKIGITLVMRDQGYPYQNFVRKNFQPDWCMPASKSDTHMTERLQSDINVKQNSWPS